MPSNFGDTSALKAAMSINKYIDMQWPMAESRLAASAYPPSAKRSGEMAKLRNGYVVIVMALGKYSAQMT
jgi:hypothetical protein